MTLTEEEAKTKRCQEGFGPPFYDPGLQSVGMAATWAAAVQSPSHCIASGCMAWRWFDNTDDQAITEPRGYCGKAGQP